MTNFEKQLKAAIETYASLDGRTEEEIMQACQESPEGLTAEGFAAENIKLLMFAAR